ncbi:hypothetical protein N5D61_06815 [Pseudomonas sp. GD03842]|uniref:hypothetical protein n=1 Tax=unclassified Pseudomonas TaxID=196821 RepID=UPI0011BE1708|nr:MULTISPECIES: hypothetical protein [unclassified Pseudomonas]MDH0746052.1 hypothetical protein [Pseudomonas sp. GD03842]
MLMLAFFIPLINLWIAGAPELQSAVARRFALIAIATPASYVFFGVLTYMAGSQIPDVWSWSPAWLLIGSVICAMNGNEGQRRHVTASSKLRFAHGVCGSLASLYALFHIGNHAAGIFSVQLHSEIMEFGRAVYRSTLGEPLLVAVMLFQVLSGIRLIWCWSEAAADRYRTFQVASGAFMALFILGHMNSVFVFARIWLGIPTDWSFATGEPAGLIHDSWNIRLLPHYAMGVFFTLTHLLSGLRVVLIAHGTPTHTANRLWWTGGALSGGICVVIMCGMSGLHLN